MKVGDKVIAIRTHSQGAFIKGQEYIIKDKTTCSCGKLSIFIGVMLKSYMMSSICRDCFSTYNGRKWWFCSTSFRKIEPKFTNEVTKELKEQFKEIERFAPEELEKETV